nr:ubiquitin conjugating enzyme e2 b [Quercus suber]
MGEKQAWLRFQSHIQFQLLQPLSLLSTSLPVPTLHSLPPSYRTRSLCSLLSLFRAEYGDIQNTPPPGCRVKLAKEDDMNGGVFHIQITLPKDYPFKPPTLSFRTKIYHPNVTNDERGSMCLGMLRADEWKPPNKIVDVLKLVRAVLAAPQADDAVETGIADEFKTNRQSFDRTAKAWVLKYAK